MDLDLGNADLSDSTRALVQRLVALDPGRRPRSAREALGLMDGPRPILLDRRARPTRRSSARAVLAVIMLMLVCVLAGCAFALARSTSQATPHAAPY